jgi:hypothetical protein
MRGDGWEAHSIRLICTWALTVLAELERTKGV